MRPSLFCYFTVGWWENKYDKSPNRPSHQANWFVHIHQIVSLWRVINGLSDVLESHDFELNLLNHAAECV